MPLIRISAEELRKPEDSTMTVMHIENAEECYGEICGQYHDLNGTALKPDAHSHLVITGHDPETTPRYYPIRK